MLVGSGRISRLYGLGWDASSVERRRTRIARADVIEDLRCREDDDDVIHDWT